MLPLNCPVCYRFIFLQKISYALLLNLRASGQNFGPDVGLNLVGLAAWASEWNTLVLAAPSVFKMHFSSSPLWNEIFHILGAIRIFECVNITRKQNAHKLAPFDTRFGNPWFLLRLTMIWSPTTPGSTRCQSRSNLEDQTIDKLVLRSRTLPPHQKSIWQAPQGPYCAPVDPCCSLTTGCISCWLEKSTQFTKMTCHGAYYLILDQLQTFTDTTLF